MEEIELDKKEPNIKQIYKDLDTCKDLRFNSYEYCGDKYILIGELIDKGHCPILECEMCKTLLIWLESQPVHSNSESN